METNTYAAKEVAEKIGVSAWTYRRMVREGRAPVMPIPGTRRYSKALVDFYVDAKAQIDALKAEIDAK